MRCLIHSTRYQHFIRLHSVVKSVSWVNKPGMEPAGMIHHHSGVWYLVGLGFGELGSEGEGWVNLSLERENLN